MGGEKTRQFSDNLPRFLILNEVHLQHLQSNYDIGSGFTLYFIEHLHPAAVQESNGRHILGLGTVQYAEH
jgi:hypothetical protein